MNQHGGSTRQAQADQKVSIDDLLDIAVSAVNGGDTATAAALAEQIRAVDAANSEVGDLLSASWDTPGQIRRLTLLFCDLVDSTVLSTRVEPETYRTVVSRYHDIVAAAIRRYQGHIESTKGDGLLAVFGHPVAHEDDASRAVHAGLDITRDVTRLSMQAARRFGVHISVRVGIHRGPVYLDVGENDVYGLAANLTARVSGLAPPDSVVVSDAIAPLVRESFELQQCAPAAVKGVDTPVSHHRVLGERRAEKAALGGPFVGRDEELATLRTAWAQAAAGALTTPGIVFRGEAGIGKSRLASEAMAIAQRDGGFCLKLSGSPLHTESGLYPIRAMIERRCGIERFMSAEERLRLLTDEIAAVGLRADDSTPLLAPVLGIAPEHGYRPAAADGERLQQMVNDTVLEYLSAALPPTSGLLIAEDTHWFDSSTRAVLETLIGHADGRLLVVATSRPGTPIPGGCTVIDLPPLSEEQSDQLIAALAPTISDQRREQVRQRCDGVPFFLEQVLATLDPADADDAAVPESLYEPLVARLRASRDALLAVESAAVIGRHCDRTLLAAVSEIAEPQIGDVVAELENSYVLQPCGPDRWRFRHELLREVAIELAPPSLRRTLHSRVADAMVGTAEGNADWSVVARHLVQAERFDDAARAYQEAGETARRRGALAEARTHLTHGLAQIERMPAGPERDRREMALRLQRGFLAASADGVASGVAVEDFERCLELGCSTKAGDDLFATLVALADYYAARADLAKFTRLLTILRDGLGSRPQHFVTVVDALEGCLALLRGDYDSARRLIGESLARFTASGEELDARWLMPNDPVTTAQLSLALAQLVAGEPEVAEAELDRAAMRTERLPFPQGPYSLAFVRYTQIWCRIEAGQLKRAAEPAADLTDQAQQTGLAASALFAATQRAAVSAVAALADPDSPLETLVAHLDALTGLLATWRGMGMNVFTTFYDVIVARLLQASGRLQDARAHLDAALQFAADTGMSFYDAELLRTRAGTLTDVNERASALREAAALARRQSAPLFELRAAVDEFTLCGQAARARLREALSRLPQTTWLPEAVRARELLGQR